MHSKFLLQSLVIFTVFTVFTVMLNQVVLAGNGSGNGYRSGTANGNQPVITNISNCLIPTDTSITATEADDLRFMREEEKLARDVYRFLGEKWQLPIFDNIANSEENHMAQVKCLLDAYQLPDSASTIMGQFNNPDLQSLYDQLIQRGQISLSEALRVGALIEEVDIKDLQDALTRTQIPEIRSVYQSLIAGSENHLRAFTRTLAQQGESYTAQIMPQEEVERVLVDRIAVFDLKQGVLRIPEVQIQQDGQLLPNEGTYHLELKAISDDTLQIIRVQRLR